MFLRPGWRLEKCAAGAFTKNLKVYSERIQLLRRLWKERLRIRLVALYRKSEFGPAAVYLLQTLNPYLEFLPASTVRRSSPETRDSLSSITSR